MPASFSVPAGVQLYVAALLLVVRASEAPLQRVVSFLVDRVRLSVRSTVTPNVFIQLLASITFIITTFSGNKYYWKHILMPPVPKALYPIMVPIEIIGMLTKPFALMIRLFANIAAGHIIILSLISLIFIFKTVAIAPVSGLFVMFMTMLELLVAALQAYVFTLLSALFIGQAVADDHH